MEEIIIPSCPNLSADTQDRLAKVIYNAIYMLNADNRFCFDESDAGMSISEYKALAHHTINNILSDALVFAVVDYEKYVKDIIKMIEEVMNKTIFYTPENNQYFYRLEKFFELSLNRGFDYENC